MLSTRDVPGTRVRTRVLWTRLIFLDPDPDPRFLKTRTRTRTRDFRKLGPGPGPAILRSFFGGSKLKII